jgi:hypothetical protein
VEELNLELEPSQTGDGPIRRLETGE